MENAITEKTQMRHFELFSNTVALAYWPLSLHINYTKSPHNPYLSLNQGEKNLKKSLKSWVKM